MSAAEIIAELPHLSEAELERIRAKLRELAKPHGDTPQIRSPRLARPDQIKDFVKQVMETAPDAQV